jgi:hypothetical protein
VIEYSIKALSKLTFASAMRKSPRSRQRHPVEAFSTIYWFHELRQQLNSGSAAELQRAIEPLSNGTPEQLENLQRRWRDYRHGLHSPSAPVIALAEARCPGSRQVLKSPFWDSLRHDKPAKNAALALIGRTSPLGDDLLAGMLGIKTQSGGRGYNSRWLRKRCNAMVREASLEGLGVLTVCVRLAGDAGYEGLAATLFRAVKRSLEILGPFLLAYGIALRLAEYYECVLLPDCGQDSNLVNFDSPSFFYTLSALCRMLQAKAEAKNMEWLEYDEAVAEILGVLGSTS